MSITLRPAEREVWEHIRDLEPGDTIKIECQLDGTFVISLHCGNREIFTGKGGSLSEALKNA